MKRVAEPIDIETFLTRRGVGRGDIGDAGMHKRGRNQSNKQWKRIVEAQARKDVATMVRREALTAEYQRQVGAGLIRPSTGLERIERAAAGHPDNESVQAARRVLERRLALKAG